MEELEPIKQKLKALIPTLDFYNKGYCLIAKHKGWAIQIGFAHSLCGHIEITAESGVVIRFKDFDIVNYAIKLAEGKQPIIKAQALKDFLDL